jgi:hypothetical protein
MQHSIGRTVKASRVLIAYEECEASPMRQLDSKKDLKKVVCPLFLDSIISLLFFSAIACVIVQTLITSQPEATEVSNLELTVEGLTYKYEAIRPSLGGGLITIRNSQGKLQYQETTFLQPGMCPFPAVSKFPQRPLGSARLPLGELTNKERWLVVLCGTSTGQHQMLKIFLSHPVYLMSTTLEFGSTTPNLKDIDGDGFYEAMVYRRILFDDIGYSRLSYLTVYKLHIDETLFGFVPTFGGSISKTYLDYYMSLKQQTEKNDLQDVAGPMLAALFAIQDESSICKELKSSVLRRLTVKDLQDWSRRLSNLGYPSFAFAKCEGVAK